MTEERMICVKQTTMIRGLEIIWLPVEPAPPKDWLPFCHKDKGNGKCVGAFPEINDYHPKCTECIWWEYVVEQ